MEINSSQSTEQRYPCEGDSSKVPIYDQPPSQDCPLATNQRLNRAEIEKQQQQQQTGRI